jgi:RHS repeat-associated protein
MGAGKEGRKDPHQISCLVGTREWDPDGLYYYRARYYDPKIGRFLSDDPLGFEGGDSNFYAYVFNDPVSLSDPSGLTTQICCRPVGGGVGFATGQNHCFIVIFGNRNMSGGTGPGGGTHFYSLIPAGGVGVPRKNYKEDVNSYFDGTAHCYPVKFCGPCKEQHIENNYMDPGPSRNYYPTGPNSNTYTRYTTTQAKCVPPSTIPNAPGY